MNIFWLDYDMRKCAMQHNDKHTVKQVLEYAQLLSSAHRIHASKYADDVYKLAHPHHPCTKWVAISSANYDKLYELFLELCAEYTHRYGRQHKSHVMLSSLLAHNPCPQGSLTEAPQAMPDECKDKDVVQAYRNYYMAEKRSMAVWTKRFEPEWWR